MEKKKTGTAVGIIPARYASSRFPGKPLALILGKSLLQRTYEQALQCCNLDAVAIATDDPRIEEHARAFGAPVIMTSPTCPTGTERVAEAIAHYPEATFVVNIQGDEPCLSPYTIEALVESLIVDPESVVSTPIIRVSSPPLSPSVVKVVTDINGHALYFSRNPIPANPEGPFYRHIGLYAFRRDFLLHYPRLAPTPLQQAEDLEQLKILEHGYKIHTVIVDTAGIEVNHPEDIKKVEEYLCKQNSSSSQAASALP